MLLLRSIGLIIVIGVVANTMAVHLIKELGPHDESYVQPISEMATTVAMMSSVKTILKPSIRPTELKKGSRFLDTIKFFCYMDK